MPKMPGAEQLGYVRPRVNTAIASADMSAIGRGAQQLGQGIANLGADLSAVVQEKRQQQGTTELSGANASYAESVLAADREINNSPDYSTYGKTFDERSSKALAQGASLISDPKYREKWVADKKVDLANRRQSILGDADVKQKEAFRVNLGSAIEKDQNIFTDPATPEAEKNAALGRIRDSIGAAEKTGLLDPVKAKQWRDTYENGSIVKEAELRVLNDPEFRQEVLRGDSTGNVVDRIIGVESGGRADAKNPKSSATGAGQFITSTWLNTVKAHRPDLLEGRTTAEVLALRNDGDLSREMTGHLASENASFLKNQGLQTTDGNVYLAHFLGPGGAARVLKADPSSPIADIVGQDAVNANPFLKGKTAADVVAWADKKMGSKAGTSSVLRQGMYGESLSPEQRQALLDAARRKDGEYQVERRNDIETVVNNAPTAIMNTGQYTGQMPSQQQFMEAYGADGQAKYDQFRTAVDTSQQVYNFQTLPEDSITQIVNAAKPVSTGDDAALETARYDTLQKAAAQTVKLRETDPATYVQQAFPNVAQAWEGAQASGDYQSALMMTAAAQQSLGVKNMQLLPKSVADGSVKLFSDQTKPEQDRINAVTGLIFSTKDPAQQRAVFDQLVKAGLPDVTEGAVEAYARGDEGAGRRLMQAAIVDPSKLPGQAPFKPAEIDAEIQSQIMDEGQIGDIFYGLSDGSAENQERAIRDSKLLTNAVNLRVRNGETLDLAVQGAAKDLYGDIKPITGNLNVNAQIVLPTGADPTPVLDGLTGLLPTVRSRLEESVVVPKEAGVADGGKAVLQGVRSNYIENVMSEGYFRNSGNGYVFMDPFVGAAVAGADGKPLMFTDSDVLGASKIAPPDLGLMTDDAELQPMQRTQEEIDRETYGEFAPLLNDLTGGGQ